MVMKMYYVYVLKNKEKGIYIGYTADLKRRITDHNSNHKGYTGKGDWECVYYEAYKDERDARAREKLLKRSWNSKKWLKDRIKHSIED